MSSYVRARGATAQSEYSYLNLPQVLQFFTANIGLHHIHHLIARIPNYNLQRARDANPMFRAVPTLSLTDGLRAVRLKLWDDDRGRLVNVRAGASRHRRTTGGRSAPDGARLVDAPTVNGDCRILTG